MLLTIENKKYQKQIEYALSQLVALVSPLGDKGDIYYGKIKPENFNGVFIKEAHFWDNYKEESSLPNNIVITDSLVVLYGTVAEPDLVAATFFMLTRYEELFVSECDKYGRFAAVSSLAFKYNFLDRPVVNEYAEYFYDQLKKIYPQLQRQLPEFKVIFTHDVDKIGKSRWSAILTEIKNVLRLRLSGLPGILYHLFNYRNPADTFAWLNKLEQGQGIYFFMPKSEDGHLFASKKIQKLVKKLDLLGYKIGIHPDLKNPLPSSPSLAEYQFSGSGCSQPEQSEWLRTGEGNFVPACSRNHFLIFDVNKTWDELAAVGIKEDYTLAYADRLGFRAGCCSPFKVYSLTQEKELDLMEYPLTMMDVTLYAYMRLSPQEAWGEFIKYYSTIKKYNGIFILLWHNFSLDELRWRRFYAKAVRYLWS